MTWTRLIALLILVAAPTLAQDETMLPLTDNANDGGTSCDTNAYATLDDDPDSPGGDWCTADNNNTSWTFMFTMDDPSGALDNSADAQVIEYYVQSFDEGQSADPDIQMSIYDTTTVACDTLHEAGTLTSITDAGFPAKITDTWTSAGLSSPNDVCVEIVCTKTGGSPGARNSCNIDALEWDVTLGAAGDQMMVISGRLLYAEVSSEAR